MRGAFVVVVGPDGVGKTALARELLEAHDGPTAYVHFRPSLRHPPPVDADGGGPPPPTKEPPSGPVVLSVLRLMRSFLVFWGGYLRWIRPARRRGTMVVADRWIYGYVGQPRALRYRGPERLASVLVAMAPRPDLVVNLHAAPAIVHARKAELTEDEIEVEQRRWAALPVETLHLEATSPPSELAAVVTARLAPGGQDRPTFKAFPPPKGSLLLPTDRRGALQGLSMYAGCSRKALLAQQVTASLIRRVGPRAIPGPTVHWHPPIGDAAWDRLTERWRDELGHFDSYAVHQRRQTDRPGFSLLLLDGGTPVAFVRVERDDALDDEAAALALLAQRPPTTFWAPTPLAHGADGDVSYLATTTFPAGLHRPAAGLDPSPIVDEVALGLEQLDRPTSTPSHWRPAHADLAPWNLRIANGGRLVLFDWEHVRWAPPGADAVFYLATDAALSGRVPERWPDAEPVEFWRAEMSTRPETPGTERFGEGLHRALAAMAGTP